MAAVAKPTVKVTPTATINYATGFEMLDSFGPAAGTYLRPLIEGPRRPTTVIGAVRGRYSLLRVSGSDRALVCIEAHGGPLLPISIAVTSDIINDIQHNSDRILLGEGTLQISDRRVALNRWRDDRISPTIGPGGFGSLARVMRFSLALAPPPSES